MCAIILHVSRFIEEGEFEGHPPQEPLFTTRLFEKGEFEGASPSRTPFHHEAV
jgi:hypothetical protein